MIVFLFCSYCSNRKKLCRRDAQCAGGGGGGGGGYGGGGGFSYGGGGNYSYGGGGNYSYGGGGGFTYGGGGSWQWRECSEYLQEWKSQLLGGHETAAVPDRPHLAADAQDCGKYVECAIVAGPSSSGYGGPPSYNVTVASKICSGDQVNLWR